MKEVYANPKMEIVEFDCEDVITNSPGNGDTDIIPTDPNTTDEGGFM